MAPPKGGYAPNLEKFLDSLKSRPVDASVHQLSSLLKRRQIKGSEACAIATAHVLLQVVARDKWTDIDQLLGRVQLVGQRLAAAQPRELIIGNIVRRVLGFIRDEAAEDRNDAASDSISDHHDIPPHMSASQSSVPEKAIRPPTLNSLGSFGRTQSIYNLLATPEAGLGGSNPSTPGLGSGASTPLHQPLSTNVSAFRSEVIGGIEEILEEIKQVDEQIQTYSETVIHPGDYILVHQPSRTVQKFLSKLASKRKFTVFLVTDGVVVSGTDDPYASLRKSMASGGSTLINVANVGLMPYMSRVNKVIIGAHAISGSGGVLADAGAATIASAAREMGRAVIVLGGVYKICPDNDFKESDLIEWGDSSRYVGFSDGSMVQNVTVKSAVSEYIAPGLVSSYISNLGAHTQDHLRMIINDHYKEGDMSIDL